MALLAPIRDRFAWPAGYAPGIDPTHIAVRRFLRFSGVATGGGFARLDKPSGATGIVGTIASVLTKPAIYGNMGPVISNATTTGISFSGNSVVAPTSCTIGAIFMRPSLSTNGIIFCVTGAATACPMFWVNPSDNNLHLGSTSGSPELSSGITIAAGIPYFGVASYAINSSGFVKFAVTNLNTGNIQTASVANTFGAVASNGTYVVACDGVGDSSILSVAAVLYSTAPLFAADVLAWAGNPWAAWYPDLQYLDDFIVGARAPTPPGPGPNFLSATLPMMGV